MGVGGGLEESPEDDKSSSAITNTGVIALGTKDAAGRVVPRTLEAFLGDLEVVEILRKKSDRTLRSSPYPHHPVLSLTELLDSSPSISPP